MKQFDLSYSLRQFKKKKRYDNIKEVGIVLSCEWDFFFGYIF